MARTMEIINRAVWGIPLLLLILGVGMLFSLVTRFAQIRLFPRALALLFRKFSGKGEENGISSFQALCTALAATVGTGNLVGVAGAIALGGPGSIFWMWISAIFGMVTKYGEASLAVHFRLKEKDGYLGGPMYMIFRGLSKQWHCLAPLYCILGIFASFGVGNATQVNAVLTGLDQAAVFFGTTFTPGIRLAVTVALALLIGVLLSGGAKRIGSAAELLVPFVSCGYLVLCVWVLFRRWTDIPTALGSIVSGAFSPQAVTGGVLGSAFQTLRIGVSRGVFTNEAGMGTASIAHAGADVAHPCEQGLMGMMEVFLDTIVICTMTALVILLSGVPIPYGVDAGGRLTMDAFSAVCGDWICLFLTGAVCCFAFATILGWGLYGGRCAQFLFGEKSWKCYVWIQSGMVILASVLKTGTIWSLAEILNGLMAVPNLIALVGLRHVLRELTCEYENKCGDLAAGGTYENFNQCKPLSAFSHAKVPSLRAGGKKTGKENLSSEHRSA